MTMISSDVYVSPEGKGGDGRILLTGDTHGERGRFNPNSMSGEFEFGERDVLIVTGDWGYVFLDNFDERKYLDELEGKPYTIAFVDGNHENFPALRAYPEEIWCGGKIHRIRKNIIHLERGQVFNILGRTVFTMGGAYSIDRMMRRRGYSFWDEELPSDEEYKSAAENLRKCGMKVDIIVTHTAPREIVRRMGYESAYEELELEGFLEWIMYEVEFSDWYFGHFHIDRDIDEKFHALLFDVKEAR